MIQTEAEINLIGQPAASRYTMPFETNSGHGPCELCGGIEWIVDDYKGEITCAACGYVVEKTLEAHHPKKEEATQGGHKPAKREVIPGIVTPHLQKAYTAGSALDRRASQTRKVTDIKQELERMCVDRDELAICKEYVDRLKRAQDDFVSRNNSKIYSMIGVGKRPAEVNTFCIACAIIIRAKRDRDGTSANFGTSEILELLRGQYCDEDGFYVIGDQRYKPTAAQKGLRRSIRATISDYTANLNKLIHPSYGIRRATSVIEAMMWRVEDFLRKCTDYYRLGDSNEIQRAGDFDDFCRWCVDEIECVDEVYAKCSNTRTKKVFAAIVAAEFLPCGARDVMNLGGITGAVNHDVKNNAENLIVTWRLALEGVMGENGVQGS